MSREFCQSDLQHLYTRKQSENIRNVWYRYKIMAFEGSWHNVLVLLSLFLLMSLCSQISAFNSISSAIYYPEWWWPKLRKTSDPSGNKPERSLRLKSSDWYIHAMACTHTSTVSCLPSKSSTETDDNQLFLELISLSSLRWGAVSEGGRERLTDRDVCFPALPPSLWDDPPHPPTNQPPPT